MRGVMSGVTFDMWALGFLILLPSLGLVAFTLIGVGLETWRRHRRFNRRVATVAATTVINPRQWNDEAIDALVDDAFGFEHHRNRHSQTRPSLMVVPSPVADLAERRRQRAISTYNPGPFDGAA